MRADPNRVEALRLGSKRYFTGKPCSKGHIAERQVSNKACLRCMADKQVKRSKSEQGKAYLHEYRQRDHVRAKNKARSRAYRESHSVYHHDRLLKYKYGLSAVEYEQMLAAQGGVCAICGNEPQRKRLAVDHCHKTGRIRGLLCDGCNVTLGNYKDNPEMFRRAIKYLEEGSYGEG